MESKQPAFKSHIHCQNCSISELCLPFSLNEEELNSLDNIIDRKKPIHKGEKLFQSGDDMKSLYAVRSGTFKTYKIDEKGEQQITGSNDMPKLKKQMLRMMSMEICSDQEMLMLLNHKNAEQRLATFISTLSNRFQKRGFSPSEFRLTMTRSDIGNYIGLTVETISRLLNRFNKSDLIGVEGKLITIKDVDGLNEIAQLKVD